MAIAQHTDTPLDRETVDRLSAAFHRCFERFEADPEAFATDAFYDLLPPFWRFQLQGDGEILANQLRSISEGPISIEVIRTIPTASGFVTENLETSETPEGTVTARRIHLCEVRDGRITEVTTYCNGPWDEELRTRHAAEAPMLRP